eukprot:Skav213856  [mRNA]  locus=scaffold2366:197120:202090:- [translate_table: standard]
MGAPPGRGHWAADTEESMLGRALAQSSGTRRAASMPQKRSSSTGRVSKTPTNQLEPLAALTCQHEYQNETGLYSGGHRQQTPVQIWNQMLSQQGTQRTQRTQICPSAALGWNAEMLRFAGSDSFRDQQFDPAVNELPILQ